MSRVFEKLASQVFIWQRTNNIIFLVRNILFAGFVLPDQQAPFVTGGNLLIWFTLLSAIDFRAALLTSKNPSESLWNTQWSTQLLVCLFNLVIGLAALPFLSATRSPDVLGAFAGLLVLQAVDALTSSHMFRCEKNMEYPFIMKVLTVSNIISLAVGIAFAMNGWGWKAMLIDRAVVTCVTTLFLIWKRPISLRFQVHPADWKEIWHFARVLAVAAVLAKVAMGADLYVIAGWLGESDPAIYQMGMKWAMYPMELGAGFLSMMALSWYSSQTQQSSEALRTAYSTLTFHLTRFCTWVAVMMAIWLSILFRFLYPDAWNEVPLLFFLLLPYAIGRPLWQNGFQILQSIRKLWAVNGITLVMAIMAVTLCYFGKKWGIQGVALASGSVMLAGWILSALSVEKLVQPGNHGRILFPIALGCGVTALAFMLNGQKWSQIPDLAARAGLSLIYTACAAWEWQRRRPRS